MPKCANLKDNIGRKFLPENSLQLKIDQNFYITTVKERKVSIKLISEFIEKEFAYDAENSFHIDFAPLLNEKNSENLYLLIDYNSDTIIGHIGICYRKLGDTAVAFIGGICIAKAYQGNKLFSPFFKTVLTRVKERVAFMVLWSNLANLYEKYGFHLAGEQFQYPAASGTALPWKKAKELTELDIQSIKSLFKIQSHYWLMPTRETKDWQHTWNIKSASFYIHYNENNEALFYCVKDKGQDLTGIIHELAFNPNTIGAAEMLQQFDHPCWMPIKISNDCNIQFAASWAVGSFTLFSHFIRKWSRGRLQVLSTDENQIHFFFNEQEYHLAQSDFITMLFGPNPAQEFKEFLKTIYIPGLDSI